MRFTACVVAVAAALAWVAGARPAVAAVPTLDELARHVQRAESIRDVKNLQRTYAQYAQFGLWDEMAALFAPGGTLDTGTARVTGPAAIAAYLTRQYGHGHPGLRGRAVRTELIAAPVVNLSVDGHSAQGRWEGFFLLSDAQGHARIEGGVFENTYVRQDGVWKIAELHFHPQYAGPYASGWTNVGGKDLPIVPFHFNADGAGVPIPTPVGAAPKAQVSLGQLEARIGALNDEDQVRNLQAAYNYYVDRKLWDDVADLFAAHSVVEIGGVGVYAGPAGARRAMQLMGPAGLRHGELNDHLLFDDVAQILPGGHEARVRGYELGMVGEADQGTAHWEVNVFDNRFIKEDGVWKVREMRIFPLLRSAYRQGWGKSRLSAPVPAGALAPEQPVPAADRGSAEAIIPAFHAPNPVTGRAVALPAGKRFVAVADLTGPIPTAAAAAAPAGSLSQRLAEAARRLAVATAYDGVENVTSAYGYFIDDFQWPQMARLFGRHGAKEIPFAGYYRGTSRIAHAVFLEYGNPQVKGRSGIAFHWLIQPVILVARDGRSASARSYLFHPDTAKKPGSANLMGAMYPDDQFVLEDGVWRWWNLALDEPYFTMPGGWKGGWSGKAPPRSTRSPPPKLQGGQTHYFGAALVKKFPPDVAISALGVREAHYRGGTGETWQWPQILPMWWGYRNPVSGRTPKHFLPDCVPCKYAPQLSMSHHGYLLPPTGPLPPTGSASRSAR